MKACICFSVTHRELTESRQNAGICWFRAPRHYSASLLVVTRQRRSVSPVRHAFAWHINFYRALGSNRRNGGAPLLLPVAILSPEQRGLPCRSRRPADQPISVVTGSGRLLHVVGIVPAQVRFNDLVAFGVGCALDIGCVEEYVLYRQIEKASDPERYFQRGRVLTSLDRHQRLAAHANDFGQFLLRYLTGQETTPPNGVGNGHDSLSMPTKRQLHGGPEDIRRGHNGQLSTQVVPMPDDHDRQHAANAFLLKRQVHRKSLSQLDWTKYPTSSTLGQSNRTTGQLYWTSSKADPGHACRSEDRRTI